MNQYNRNQQVGKTWWGPVWRGLVVDDHARHYRMGKAVWLFLYLVIHADRKTGKLFRRYQTIASDMGRPERTIRRWLLTLRRYGYMEVRRTGHSQVIHIRKWKTLSRPAKAARSIH